MWRVSSAGSFEAGFRGRGFVADRVADGEQEAEGVMLPLFFKAGETGLQLLIEEPGKGFVQILQRLLQGLRVNLFEEWVLFLPLRQQ